MKSKNSSRLKTVLAAVFLIAVSGALLQRQAILDWWALRNYTAPAEISALADKTAMNDSGRHLFYVYHPKLEGRDTFRSDCANFEHSIVLGCYKSLSGIYIFDVNDERLDGVEEVTAAHEMLHVAYERLSQKEKDRVGALLRAEEVKLTDERIKANLAAYRQEPSADIENEMHSIFGTELETLSPELEIYYNKYFTDRKPVVDLAKKYEAEFVSRENKISVIDKQLDEKKAAFDTLKTQIDQQGEKLEAEQLEMQVLKTSNPAEFNARLSGYNAAVRSYKKMVSEAQKLIEEYNQLIEQRNALALERRSLLQALDSRASAL